ncbi:hypothetical protein QQ054_21245 [Oscillatoria amoena NRMC-F 0135]|nr:hypothetical protein [Oscillatoria amoena NRMC-F 0135]
MAKALSTLFILFLLIITLPVLIGLGGGLIGAGIGIVGAFFGIVFGIFGAIVGVIGSILGAIAEAISAVFGGVFHPVISVKPITILLIILVIVLFIRSQNKAVK